MRQLHAPGFSVGQHLLRTAQSSRAVDAMSFAPYPPLRAQYCKLHTVPSGKCHLITSISIAVAFQLTGCATFASIKMHTPRRPITS